MLIAAWWYLPLLLVSVAMYHTIPTSWRRLGLPAISLLVLSLVSWRSTLGFVAVAATTYYLASLSRRRIESPLGSRATFLAAIALNLGYLSLYKYLPSVAPPAAAVLAFSGNTNLIPLGLSYFTFRFLHYVIESRRGVIPAHTFQDFFAYASLFTIFPAGPIERFQVLEPQLRSTPLVSSDIADGLTRIVIGSFKKIVLADLVVTTLMEALGRVVEEFDTYSWRSQYAHLWGALLYLYFDFSGYSDIAIGTSRLFGLRVSENFDSPLIKTNVSDFWRSWHMSLTSWCRDYVYFPVFGYTRNPKVALYASMLVLGAWHGTQPGWLVWGAWQATGLVIWQLWSTAKRRRPYLMRMSNSRPFNLLAWGVTVNWIVLGGVWVIFSDLQKSVAYLVEILLLR